MKGLEAIQKLRVLTSYLAFVEDGYVNLPKFSVPKLEESLNNL